MAPSKNGLCPCGSGKKYKRCCGREVTRLIPAFSHPTRLAQGRNCGSCTKCCDGWLKASIHGHDVYPGKPCPYSKNHQCIIYEDRPEDPCQKFSCGWLTQNSPLPNELRPDRVNWILLPASRTWRKVPVDTLVQAGEKPNLEALDWFKHFASQNGRPLLYLFNDEWFLHGPPHMQQEFVRRMHRGESVDQILPKNGVPLVA